VYGPGAVTSCTEQAAFGNSLFCMIRNPFSRSPLQAGSAVLVVVVVGLPVADGAGVVVDAVPVGDGLCAAAGMTVMMLATASAAMRAAAATAAARFRVDFDDFIGSSSSVA
jgi:hypothetical protein